MEYRKEKLVTVKCRKCNMVIHRVLGREAKTILGLCRSCLKKGAYQGLSYPLIVDPRGD